jgi:hypothetical protein
MIYLVYGASGGRDEGSEAFCSMERYVRDLEAEDSHDRVGGRVRTKVAPFVHHATPSELRIRTGPENMFQRDLGTASAGRFWAVQGVVSSIPYRDFSGFESKEELSFVCR